jgi:hypothetical protein
MLLVVLAGCGPRAGDGESDAGGSGSASSGASSGAADSTSTTADTSTGAPEVLPDGCSCRDVDEDAFECSELATVACDGVLACDTITVQCARPNPDMYACEGELAYDEAALECALEALRDRTPGKLSIVAENAECGFEGCGRDEREIVVFASGDALVTSCSASPIGAEDADAELGALAEPAHFEGCLALAEAADRYGCLHEGLIAGEPVCG